MCATALLTQPSRRTQGLTFDSFQPRGQIGLGERQARSLEIAHNTARQYATSLKGWLLLQGGYGCGKPTWPPPSPTLR